MFARNYGHLCIYYLPFGHKEHGQTEGEPRILRDGHIILLNQCPLNAFNVQGANYFKLTIFKIYTYIYTQDFDQMY